MSDMDWIYENLRDAGVVQNQNDLSRLCGKNDSYISSRKAKNKTPSVEALAHLTFALDSELQEQEAAIRYDDNLTIDRLAAASIIYEVRNYVVAELKEICQGGRHG